MGKVRAIDIETKINLVTQRISELAGKIRVKTEDIATQKERVAGTLGSLAMEPNPELEDQLSRHRKVLQRMEEALGDLVFQHDLLKKNLITLQGSYLDARLDEIPDMVLKQAAVFNSVLENAYVKLQELKTVWSRLRGVQNIYFALVKAYSDTCSQLGKVAPLPDGCGLGPLHLAKRHYQKSFAASDSFSNFLVDLVAYGRAVQEFADTMKANPQIFAELQEAADKMSQPFEMEMWTRRNKGWSISPNPGVEEG